jgi:VWFA-related protein
MQPVYSPKPVEPLTRALVPALPWATAALIALASSFALATAGEAQPEAPLEEGVLDRVDVELVLVDLVVTGKGGDVVRDLRPEEVRVVDDGKPIAEFTLTAPQSGAVAPAAKQRSDSAALPSTEPEAQPGAVLPRLQPNTLVVFLDELHLRAPNRKRVLKQLREVVRRGMGPNDSIMIASFDGEVKVLQPPTTDFSAVLDVIEGEMDSNRSPMLAQLARPEEAMRVIEQLFSQASLGGNETFGGTIQDDPCIQMGALARTHAQQAHSVVMKSIFGLRLFVDALAPIDGRKSLLHVSDGIPTTPGSEAYSLAIELCSDVGDYETTAVLANASGWDAQRAWAELNEFQTTDEWRELSAFANASQVSFFVLQASGLEAARNAGVDNVRVTQNTESLQVANQRGALHYMADETGGVATFNTNDFRPAIQAAARDVERAYQISFTPPVAADGREHKIEVEVLRPGVTVRHRKSYFAKLPGQDLNDLVISTLVLGREGNPLEVRLAHGEVRTGAGADRLVTVEVRVPLASLALLPVEGERRGSFTVAVGGRLSNGRFLPIGQKTLSVRAADVEAESQSFLYEVEMPLRGKSVVLSVAVRDEVGGEVTHLLHGIELDSPKAASALD